MKSKSEDIYNFLERKIVGGEYSPGDRLPSESELCSEFNVSRGPVRAALDKLSAIGLVYKKKGGGSYVREQDTNRLFSSVLPALRFNTNDYREMLQMRSALDKLSIELCIENHERNDYAELDGIMKALEKNHSPEQFFELERSFYVTISELGGNRLLHSVTLMVWDLLKHCSRDSLSAREQTERVWEYRKIYQSIQATDCELALIHARRHIIRVLEADEKDLAPAKESQRWNPWLYDTL